MVLAVSSMKEDITANADKHWSGTGGFTEWHNSGVGWEHGEPTDDSGPASANSVPNCWGTDLANNHGPNAGNVAESPTAITEPNRSMDPR